MIDTSTIPGDGAALVAPRPARKLNVYTFFRWMKYTICLPSGKFLDVDAVLASRKHWERMKAAGDVDHQWITMCVGPFVVGFLIVE